MDNPQDNFQQSAFYQENLFSEQHNLLAFIKPKPKPKKKYFYKDLVCTRDDQEAIGYIVVTLSEKGKWWLMKHRSHVEAVGDTINHVHPLKFMETIFADPDLKERMKIVFDDYFKRNGFMKGLVVSLTNRSNIGELDEYLPDFAKAIGVPLKAIKPYFDDQDWDGLVRHLIYN